MGAIASAIESIAAHFETSVPALHQCLREWPERNQRMSLGLGPHLSLTLTTERVRPCAAAWAGTTTNPLQLYRVAHLELGLQMDLWALTKAARDLVAPAVMSAFHPGLPQVRGLRIPSTAYWDRQLDVHVEGGSSADGDESADVGEFRRTWQLKVHTDWVVEASSPLIAQIRARATVDGVVEPDQILPPT